MSYLDRVLLVDARPIVVWISAESDGEQLKETVHARQKSLRSVGHGFA